MSGPDRTRLPIARAPYQGVANRTLHGLEPDWTLIGHAEPPAPTGGAGLIIAYPHSAAAKVQPAVTRAIQKVVGEAEGHHVQALKTAISDAQQKMAAGGT